jgi:hypothetical protein
MPAGRQTPEDDSKRTVLLVASDWWLTTRSHANTDSNVQNEMQKIG